MVKIIQSFKNYIYNKQIEVLELQVSNEELVINVHKKHINEKLEKLIQKKSNQIKKELYPYELKTLNQNELNSFYVDQKIKELNLYVDRLIHGVNYYKEKDLKKNHSNQEKITNKANEKIQKLNDSRLDRTNKLYEKYKLSETELLDLDKNKEIYEDLKKQKLIELDEFKKRVTNESNQKFNLLKEKINLKTLDRKAKLDKLLEIKKSMNLNNETLSLDENHILSIDKLVMKFGGLTAVDQLSFNVKKNEIFGLIGPNGAGKTTVFNCITQFYKSTSGNITFLNNKNDVINLKKVKTFEVIKHGIVRTFQNVELVWELSILDNLLVAAHTLYRSNLLDHIVHSRRYKFESDVLREKAIKILTDLDLIKYKDFYPIGLPYGVLKIVELARTLIANPKLIILDEPAAGLNEVESKKLVQTIRKIQAEYQVTIFLVEHDMSLVMELCDTICAISFGKMLAIGTPSEIQKNKLVQEAYLGGE